LLSFSEHTDEQWDVGSERVNYHSSSDSLVDRDAPSTSPEKCLLTKPYCVL